MDYLVELYNKHIEENTGQKYYLNERNVKDRLDSLLILRYFIKWLVENDKIDINKTPGHYIYHYTDEDVVKEALMQLAIQDEPIKFLCEIIK